MSVCSAPTPWTLASPASYQATPIDFLQLPLQVHSLDDAIEAVRHCDRLATLTSVQSHCVKNTSHLVFSLVQHTFTQLLPLPAARLTRGECDQGGAKVESAVRADMSAEVRVCVWREPMEYADQLDLLVLLQRIMEHFAAAADSLDHTRATDAGRMVVPACIAAIADCVMRQRATDIASEASIHLAGFALSAGWLSKQAATIEVHHAELNTARVAALDYFDSLSGLPKIFEWHKRESLDVATSSYLTALCKDVAFPTDTVHLHEYVVDPHALVIKNYPELRCCHDIAYFAKLFLNPDVRRFPKHRWTQRNAELSFSLEPPTSSKKPTFTFKVTAFGDSTLLCRPKVKRGEMSPTHRFSSLAQPSEYTRPYFIESEDDVLHMWECPDFGELDVAHARALGQHDAELLLSYLTVPYLRIPLVVSFFATDDRIHSLQSPTLQALLDAALFEPGNHLPLDSAGTEPVDVPTSAPTLLGTPHHLLLNELARSPETVLSGVTRLLRQACDLDTGTLKSSTATVILYVSRLTCRVDSYVSMLLAYDSGMHDCVCGKPFRGLALATGVAEKLAKAQPAARPLWGEVSRLMQVWYAKLVRECESSDDDHVLDANTKHMCNIHAHLLPTMRNAPAQALSESRVTTVVMAMVFLSTRHEWNMALLDRKGSASYDGWRVPENEIFEAMHVLRRKLVAWLRECASQAELDRVMDSVVRVSASTGSLRPAAEEVPNRWAHVAGEHNHGRFALHSSRSKKREREGEGPSR